MKLQLPTARRLREKAARARFMADGYDTLAKVLGRQGDQEITETVSKGMGFAVYCRFEAGCWRLRERALEAPGLTMWIPFRACLSEAGAREMAKMMSEATGDRFEVQEVEVSP